MAQVQNKGKQGPCTTTTAIMIVRGRMRIRRRQEDHETTTTGVAITTMCPRVCDNHHYYLQEEERPVMTTVTGEKTQGEGSHNDTTTRKTAMVTTMQDRLQERLDKIRTSSDCIIRLTDSLRLKLLAFFSQFCFCFLF